MATDDGGFAQRMARVEELIGRAERFADPADRSVTRDIVSSLLELHGAAAGSRARCVVGFGRCGSVGDAGAGGRWTGLQSLSAPRTAPGRSGKPGPIGPRCGAAGGWSTTAAGLN